MIRAFIVEDEPLAMERLYGFVDREADLQIIGTSTSGLRAAPLINRLEPDLIFLDIHLADISGLDMLRMIERPCRVIFTTAFDQYAIKAFELNAVDYLLKPLDYERFHQAVDRARRQISRENGKAAATDQLKKLLDNWQPGANYLNRLPSKRGDKIHILNDDDIVYIASENKLVFAFMSDSKHLLNYTLEELQTRLNPDKFFRIHRSTIVNLDYIGTIESWFAGGYRVTVKDKSGTQLTVSRAAGKQLRQKLGW